MRNFLFFLPFQLMLLVVAQLIETERIIRPFTIAGHPGRGG